MFASLNQGSLIYILDKTDKPKLRIGEVQSISLLKPSFTNYNNVLNTTVDIKVKVEGTVYEYNSIPSNFSVVSYNNGKITLSETKLGLLSEVEGILLNSKLILENIDLYKLNIIDCENILKDLNPLFAKDKERDERLNSLEEKFNGVENKIDRLLTLVTDK